MNATSQTQHLITFRDWPDKEVREVLTLAGRMKRSRYNYIGAMSGRTLAMLFQKTSTRTRVSFEAAMTEMGGHAIYLDWISSNFHLSRIKYETEYLSRNVSCIMARMKLHEDLLELKSGATVPLINGCCNRYHPCQAMADMLTIEEHRGQVEGARLTYIGVHNNVANSLMAVSAALGVELTLVCPIAPEDIIDHAIKDRLAERGLLKETQDPIEGVRNAEYVYTDTWIDMEFFDNPEYQDMKEERLKIMLPYQVNAALMKHSQAQVMHDMPIHPDYEITDEVVEAPNSLIFRQAENRLDAQKAIIVHLLRSQWL